MLLNLVWHGYLIIFFLFSRPYLLNELILVFQKQQSLNNDGGLSHLSFWEEVNGVMGGPPPIQQPSSLPPPMAMIDPHHNIRSATAQIFPTSSQQQTGSGHHINDHGMNAMLIDMNIGGPSMGGYQSRDMSPCTPPYGVSAFC